MADYKVINNILTDTEFDYMAFDNNQSQIPIGSSDNKIKMIILTGIILTGLNLYVNNVPVIKSVMPDSKIFVPGDNLVTTEPNIDDIMLYNNTKIKMVATTGEIQTYEVTDKHIPVEVITHGGVVMEGRNLNSKQYYDQVNKYYSIFISGFVIAALAFGMVSLMKLSFFTPTICLIGIVMSLGGALGFFIDKKTWKVKYKC